MARRNPDHSERTPLLGEAPRQNNDASNAENGQLPHSGNNGAANDRQAPRVVLLLPALAIGLFLSALDQLIIVASYAKMGNDLHALNNVGWVATSYLLAITSFQPLFGKFCDIFGRKESLLSAYVLFGLGCFFCGISQSLVQLCLSRALTGVGGGGMTAVVSIILSDIVPLRERGLWQGYLNLIYSMGTSSGAPLGGVLADTVGWRWAFLGQVPFCLLAFASVYFFLDLPRPVADHWLTKVRRIDFLGAFTLIAAIISLFIGIDIGSNRGWSQITAVVPVAISPALFGLFIFIEMRVASHPFAPGHLIFSPGLFPSYLCNFFTIGATFGALFFAPLYFQAVRGDSATRSGLYLIPMTVCTVAASLGAGFYVRRTEKYYWHTFWANAIMGLAMVPLVVGVWYNQIIIVIIAVCLISIGGSSVITTTLVALLANAAEEDTAVVVACSYLFRSLGSSLGVTISAAVLQQLLRGELSRRLPSGDQAREIEKQVRQNLDYIKQLSKELAAIVRTSYLHACTGAVVPLVICGALAFICTIWIKEKPLKR